MTTPSKPTEKNTEKAAEKTTTPATPSAAPTVVNLSIDGIAVQVPPGTTIIQAGAKADKIIPHFCYHPGLTVVGQCRMCFVEIEGAPKLATACSTPVAEGMKVLTSSPKVKAGQNSTLEFTLLNHPLDCPICDRGGECKLQDYTYEYGPPLSRMVDDKKIWDKHRAISNQIVLDQERCILCTRCVRFSSEVDGRTELVVNDRGSHNHIDVFEGRPLKSNFSGNVVDLCPVGALTAKDFRFVARPWELRTHSAICSGCAVGCNIAIDTHNRAPGIARPDGGKPNPHIVRLMPKMNMQVNHWWMCDKGRWGYHFHNDDTTRLTTPLARRQKGQAQETISLKEIQMLIDKQSGQWEFWVDDSMPHEGIAWAKELMSSWNSRNRKVAKINPSKFGDEVLNFYASRMNQDSWIAGQANWNGIKTVVATADYRELEDVVPVLSLRLGQLVRKGLIQWVVRSTSEFYQKSDDLNATAYLAPVPKSSSDLEKLNKVPATAHLLITWGSANARGLINEGVCPTEALSNSFGSAPQGPVFYFGQRTQNGQNSELVKYLSKSSYIVVADSYSGVLSQAADVVLPLTPLYESKATLTNLENLKQFSAGVQIDHPNYEYLHRGGQVVSPSLRLF